MASYKVDYNLICSFCKSSGEPKEVYTTHALRIKGETTCKKLLNLECRYCHEKGHTVKFCNVLKENMEKQNQFSNEFSNEFSYQRDYFKKDRESLKRLFTEAFHEKEVKEQVKPRKSTLIPRSVIMRQKREKKENVKQLNKLFDNLNINNNNMNNNMNLNIKDEKQFPALERQYAVVKPATQEELDKEKEEIESQPLKYSEIKWGDMME